MDDDRDHAAGVAVAADTDDERLGCGARECSPACGPSSTQPGCRSWPAHLRGIPGRGPRLVCQGADSTITRTICARARPGGRDGRYRHSPAGGRSDGHSAASDCGIGGCRGTPRRPHARPAPSLNTRRGEPGVTAASRLRPLGRQRRVIVQSPCLLARRGTSLPAAARCPFAILATSVSSPPVDATARCIRTRGTGSFPLSSFGFISSQSSHRRAYGSDPASQRPPRGWAGAASPNDVSSTARSGAWSRRRSDRSSRPCDP